MVACLIQNIFKKNMIYQEKSTSQCFKINRSLTSSGAAFRSLIDFSACFISSEKINKKHVHDGKFWQPRLFKKVKLISEKETDVKSWQKSRMQLKLDDSINMVFRTK